jgi:hypothetical protein
VRERRRHRHLDRVARDRDAGAAIVLAGDDKLRVEFTRGHGA